MPVLHGAPWWGTSALEAHCRSAVAPSQGACCFADVGGQRATTTEELAALLSQAPAPGAPGNATPALYPFDHVLGGGAGGAGVKGEGLGVSGAAQRTAVLYGTPAAPCFGHMLAALDAAARADKRTPGPCSSTRLGGGLCQYPAQMLPAKVPARPLVSGPTCSSMRFSMHAGC